MTNQPDAFPTNKLAIGVLFPLAVQEIAPLLYAPLADAPNTTMLLGAVLALVVAYFVPDRPNT